ncbi:lipid-A-disaccharide synthase [Chitinophaga terrae (ex Kim and Jung 2007)]|uniref:Lipid-A-disaccharide synthase n=1 Tax=Chitinophaga terrae (ex Kim and Jung 2007) TaxID=408074 RepID=A0A1H4DPE9_9BACT|nr:lipid-A-disaccharide synthase [Chitinophaga terrae (ex Kim and Jung 2007)]MDQ0107872.1 lipid-A-disaccharide synthase [Chitinophaga terrae (ex Kim and Jung 2007)]GEP91043.1 lipid-A-disaccharide synthase [Chitinophaga terrae (ex Kim and Jung 2007)]SEA74487.1 lipid-A-disaccharide synthase [Chitinophaga terrae (ex Kim and Jung 2007)]
MKYYIIAGEASGDLHGSNLVKQIRQVDTGAQIRGWGGDLMSQAGAGIVKHYKDLAFMGFVEVVMNLRTILKNIEFCKKDISEYKPDVLVLVDYPGFNMRIAEWGKQQGYKIVYYISPQVWAWKENRVKKIKQSVDKLLCILPFEQEFYHKWEYEVAYVGHPLVEVIKEVKEQPVTAPLSDKPIIAILPGSRKQEVSVKLPIMLTMAKHFPDHQFIVAQAPGLDDHFLEGLTGQHPNVSMVKGQTYNLLRQATAALVTSGTATLETALFGVPEVVCYKGNPISYFFAKRLIKVKYISLVNLVMDKPVVTELIQHDLTEANLLKELTLLLKDEGVRSRVKKDYADLWHKLGERNASRRAAEIIYEFAIS